MRRTLAAIAEHGSLELQTIVTGTHTHPSRGNTAVDIPRAGIRVDRVIRWKDESDAVTIARETGRVSAKLVDAFEQLETDIVLIVGDRVEAFAAASAGHLSGRIVAHVHGGDRAMGQVDDALRHAITKLAHVHLPATPQSAKRILRLGEDRSRVVIVGAPGIDGIRKDAASRAELVAAGLDYAALTFNLLLLHPTDDSDAAERRRTNVLIESLARQSDRTIVALLPNTDPGARGIADALHDAVAKGQIHLLTHASRRLFLGLMRDCRLMVGNSSAGIIEAGSFATPVVDIGPRQRGREHGKNVISATWSGSSILRAVKRAERESRSRVTDNPYDLGGAAGRIISTLLRVPLTSEFRRKLIRY